MRVNRGTRSLGIAGVLVVAVSFGAWSPSEAVESDGAAMFLRDERLLESPDADAKSVGDVGLGAKASILQRQGPWYRVSSGELKGWVRMFSLKYIPVAGERRPRTRSAVMGVRGLGEVELREAKPDLKQIAVLDSFAVGARDLDGFERFGKQRLRAIGVSSSGGADPEQDKLEIKMGRDVAAMILGAAPLYDRSEVQKYVNQVGTWVARVSDRPGLPWRFGVIKSDSINAFAVPGGTILVTLGLYRLLRTEAELAGVLAHEIAHVARGHHFALLIQGRAMEAMAKKSSKMKLSAAAVQAVLHKMVLKGAEIFTRALDRGAELDSDRVAMLLAADAGYDPYGLPRVIQMLARTTAEEPRAALIYKTHPDPLARAEQFAEFSASGRVAELKDRLELEERFKRFSLYGVELKR